MHTRRRRRHLGLHISWRQRQGLPQLDRTHLTGGRAGRQPGPPRTLPPQCAACSHGKRWGSGGTILSERAGQQMLLACAILVTA